MLLSTVLRRQTIQLTRMFPLVARLPHDTASRLVLVLSITPALGLFLAARALPGTIKTLAFVLVLDHCCYTQNVSY